MSDYYRRRQRMYGVGVVLLLIVFIGGFALYASGMRHTERTVTAHVTDKERVCDGGQDGSCRYLVYTDDHGTFQITDSHVPGVFWRTNSSDVYGRIHRNATYRLKVIGWRFGLSSHYPNVMTAEEVKS